MTTFNSTYHSIGP